MAEVTLPAEGQPKLTRRELLNYVWLASLGILLVDVAGIGFLFSMPRFKEGEFGGVFTLGPVSALPPVDAPPVNYPKVKFWLSRSEQGVTALYKVCTHLGCLYAWRDQEGKFICPCHGSQFQYDGTYIRGPAPRSLDRFVVQVVAPDGQVLAETDPETGGPVPIPDDPDVTVKVDTGRKIIGRRHG
jgi:cytochrome b6-f complex iron-sulfur subunit